MSITHLPKKNRPLKMREEYALAALSYVFVLCFVPLLLKPGSSFVQFHAKQGLALFILEIVALLLTMTFVLAWLGGLLLFVCIFASLYGGLMAIRGEQAVIPYLDRLISKLNI